MRVAGWLAGYLPGWESRDAFTRHERISVGRKLQTELMADYAKRASLRRLAPVEPVKSRVDGMHACPSTQTTEPVSLAAHDLRLIRRLINRNI